MRTNLEKITSGRFETKRLLDLNIVRTGLEKIPLILEGC